MCWCRRTVLVVLGLRAAEPTYMSLEDALVACRPRHLILDLRAAEPTYMSLEEALRSSWPERAKASVGGRRGEPTPRGRIRGGSPTASDPYAAPAASDPRGRRVARLPRACFEAAGVRGGAGAESCGLARPGASREGPGPPGRDRLVQGGIPGPPTKITGPGGPPEGRAAP